MCVFGLTKERRVQAGGTDDNVGAKKYGTMGECDAGVALASLQNEPMPTIPDANGYADDSIHPDPDPANQVQSIITNSALTWIEFKSGSKTPVLLIEWDFQRIKLS